jgi:hypothetical protein
LGSKKALLSSVGNFNIVQKIYQILMKHMLNRLDIIGCILCAISIILGCVSLKTEGCTEQMREILKEMEIQDCEGTLKGNFFKNI